MSMRNMDFSTCLKGIESNISSILKGNIVGGVSLISALITIISIVPDDSGLFEHIRFVLEYLGIPKYIYTESVINSYIIGICYTVPLMYVLGYIIDWLIKYCEPQEPIRYFTLALCSFIYKKLLSSLDGIRFINRVLTIGCGLTYSVIFYAVLYEYQSLDKSANSFFFASTQTYFFFIWTYDYPFLSVAISLILSFWFIFFLNIFSYFTYGRMNLIFRVIACILIFFFFLLYYSSMNTLLNNLKFLSFTTNQLIQDIYPTFFTVNVIATIWLAREDRKKYINEYLANN